MKMVSRRREEFASSETESASRDDEFTLEVGERESTSTHFRFVELGGAGRGGCDGGGGGGGGGGGRGRGTSTRGTRRLVVARGTEMAL